MANDRLAARQQIEKLVQFFDSNIYQFKSPSFNETQARQQLIDPFFESLGWDMHNRLMQPLFRQEVVPESRVKSNIAREVREQEPLFPKKETLGKEYKEYTSILDYIAEDEYKASSKEAVKKPDYRFRIGGQTKFFVEAKKPSVDLVKSQEAIFQVKRYGFSGRVPLAVLTDFEEFRTFDCTQRPLFEKPKLGIIHDFDLTYKHYLDRFDLLYDTFSREAVAGGSLEALTKKMMLKRTGDFALDREFLEDLSKWREELARDIAKHPKNRRLLNDYTLNEAVQRILDRIVFIRVCEDREIEVENTLLALLRIWKERPGLALYSLLNEFFKKRRDLYNGLLFSPHPCEELEIGNEVLIKILENLNYPFSPYHFNEIGVEILGSIYEKFLGKTIHLTAKTTRIEEKPEVRKAGGVYYTPQYIVKYIVDNTLGKLLYEEKKETGFRVQGTESKTGGEDGTAIVQGIGSVETINDISGGSVQARGNPAKEGTIRIDQSDAAVGRINSSEHSGGLRTDTSGGLSPSSFDSAGIVSRIGDASGNIHQTGVSYGNTNSNSAFASRRDRQNVDTAHPISQSPLNPFPYTLTPRLTPKQAAKLKIIDIACGSGSFLLGAFQKLIDYHIEWYTAHPEDIKTENNVPDAYKDAESNYHLSPRKKRDILVNNIYGVDIDRQAVEVTQMSLYLKVLEGENAETLNPQMTLALKEVYLPSLAKNIKCGNSLIGTDFTSQGEMFDEEAQRKVNPFDWEMEFPEILGGGGNAGKPSEGSPSETKKPSEGSHGFDVVIGNPPYGAELSDDQAKYLSEKYATANYQIDTYVVFIQKSFNIIKKSGLAGLIVPSAWVVSEFGLPLRRLLTIQTKMKSIMIAPKKTFEEATVETLVIVFEKKHSVDNNILVRRWDIPEKISYQIKQEIILQDEKFLFPVYVPPDIYDVINSIRLKGKSLGSIANVVWGIKIYQIGKGKPKQTGKESVKNIFHSKSKNKKSHKPLLGGKEINRYALDWQGEYVDYGPWLAEPRSPEWFNGSRILVREVTAKGVIQATLTNKDFVFSNSVDGIKIKDITYSTEFILALLNSKLISFFHLYTSANAFKDSFPKVLLKDLLTLPIRTIDFTKPAEKKMHDNLVSLVEKMLEFNKQLQKAHFDSEKEPIERQIAATDKKIDAIVYELYGLTPEEIAIVEGKS